MAEDGGHSVAALRAKQAELVARHSAVSDADLLLRETLAGAHAATVEGRSRLEAIAAEIDSAVRNQGLLALDTSVGAREFRNFLLAKHRQIAAIITEARDLGAVKTVALQELRSQYSKPVADEA